MNFRNLQDTPSLGRLSEAEIDGALAYKFAPLPRAVLRPPLPVVYRATLGRKRAFLSQRDATAYDAGYSMYPGVCMAEPGTPVSMGYFDAEYDSWCVGAGGAGADDALAWAFANATICGCRP